MKKESAITILIAVLFALFVGFAVDKWYPQPEYPIYPQTKAITSPYDYVPPTEAQLAEYEAQSKIFEEKMKEYSKVAALILAAIGIGIILVALKMAPFEAYINLGLMWGGALTMVYAIIRYWSYIDDNYQPVIIGALLAAVIFIGMRYKKLLRG